MLFENFRFLFHAASYDQTSGHNQLTGQNKKNCQKYPLWTVFNLVTLKCISMRVYKL